MIFSAGLLHSETIVELGEGITIKVLKARRYICSKKVQVIVINVG